MKTFFGRGRKCFILFNIFLFMMSVVRPLPAISRQKARHHPGLMMSQVLSNGYRLVVDTGLLSEKFVNRSLQSKKGQMRYRFRVAIPPLEGVTVEARPLNERTLSGEGFPITSLAHDDDAFFQKGWRLIRKGRFRYVDYMEFEVTSLIKDNRIGEWMAVGSWAIEIKGQVVPHQTIRDFPEAEQLYRSLFLNPDDAKTFSYISIPKRENLKLQGFSGNPLEGRPVPVLNGPYLGKIPIQQDGVYIIDASQLLKNGIDINLIDPYQVVLMDPSNRIIDVIFEGDTDHILEPGERWIFYGESFHPKGRLADDFQKGRYTQTNYYRLKLSTTPHFMQAVDASPGHGYPTLGQFNAHVHIEPSKSFFSGTPVGNDDHWFATLYLNKNVQDTLTFDLPGLLNNGTVQLTFEILGLTSDLNNNPDHHLVISKLTSGVPTVLLDVLFDGFTRYQVSDTFPAQFFEPTGNQLNFKVVDDLGVQDVDLVDWIDVTYPRDLVAKNDELILTPPQGLYQYQISGFSSPDIWVFDLTDPRHPKQLQHVNIMSQPNGYAVTFEYQSEANTVLYIVAQSQFRSVSEIEPVKTIQDVMPRFPIEHLIIAAPAFADAPELKAYVQYRRQQGIPSMLVNVNDIYDAFLGGVKHPEAIFRYFESLFNHGPSPAPLYVVFVGDLTDDFLNDFNNPDYTPDDPRVILSKFIDFPRAGESFYANDFLLGRVVGNDNLPDLIAGRISVLDVSQLQDILQKIESYEQAPPGPWQWTVTMVADEPHSAGDEVFETVHDAQESLYFSDPLVDPYQVKKVYANTCCAGDPAAMRQEVVQAWNAGTAVMSFAGHGSHQFWGFTPFLESTDPDLLTDFVPQASLPFVINVSCRTGGFHKSIPGVTFWDAFMETFLRLPERGILASLAPSNIDDVFTVGNTLPLFYEAMFSRAFRYRTIGQVAFHIWTRLLLQNAIHDAQNLALFGDPVVTLRLPTVETPTGLTAEGKVNQIDLTWNSVPDAIGYLIYRKGPDDRDYVRVTDALVLDPSWSDSNVSTGETYSYRVTAVNTDMFESRWGDPVSAVPLAEVPQAPQNLTAQDLGIGNSVALSWLPPSGGPIMGYRISFGTQSGNYTIQMNVPPTKTNVQITGLINGQTYYFIVQTINQGLTSAPSNEASAVPSRDGYTGPVQVFPLMVFKSGSDIRLEWSYVGSASIEGYRVYRDTQRDVQFTSFQLVCDIQTPDVQVCVDGSATSSPQTILYYVVRAVVNGGQEVP